MTSARSAASQKARRDCGALVPNDSQVDDVRAQALKHAGDGVAVAVVDGAGLEALPDRAELVSGGEGGHPKPASNLDAGNPERGEQTELRGVDPLALGRHQRTTFQVLAGLSHVLANVVPCGDGDPTLREPDLFLHDDSIGAGGHYSPGHDPHRATGGDGAGKGLARPGGSEEPEGALAPFGQVRPTESVSVHRGVGMARHREGGDHVGREDSAERVPELYLLAFRQGADVGVDALERFSRRQQLGIVVATEEGHGVHVKLALPRSGSQSAGRHTLHANLPPCAGFLIPSECVDFTLFDRIGAHSRSQAALREC